MKFVNYLIGCFKLIAVSLVLFACSGLDDVNSRLERVEKDVLDIKTSISLLKSALEEGKVISQITPLKDEFCSGWVITFSDGSSIIIQNGGNGDSIIDSINFDAGIATIVMLDGTSFSFKTTEFRPRLTSFGFLAQDNNCQLLEDVNGTIEGDSLVVCWIPHLMVNKKLIPHFTFEGDYVIAGDAELVSDTTVCDFSKPVGLIVKWEGQEIEYRVLVHTYTGLPICWIDTENRAPVVSKEEYINATFRLMEGVDTKSPGETIEGNMQIKGRGNTTWNKFPKKPYRLKFENKVSLLNEAKDKSWVLLANYADKTMLRNDITFYLGSVSNLDYTPSSHFVELILNGSYQGTYQLTDKIKISKSRVNVGNDGFLLEIDDYAPYESDTRFFRVNHLGQPCINIKEPAVEYDDENYTYAKQFVLAAEETLFSDTFTDTENGWQKYMDINTFVDYYIISEITKNTDAMWASSFMNLERGGKLKMGPLWDYDLAYGNYCGIADVASSDGFKVKRNPWYSRLFEDPAFVSKVKERYSFFYDKKSDIANRINQMAVYLKYSAQENNNKWGVLYLEGWPNVNAWGSYQNELYFLKEWLFARMDWLKAEFDAM